MRQPAAPRCTRPEVCSHVPQHLSSMRHRCHASIVCITCWSACEMLSLKSIYLKRASKCAEAGTAVLAADVAQALAPLATQPLLGGNPRTVAGLLRLLAAFVGSAARADTVVTVLEHCEVQLQCLQVGC